MSIEAALAELTAAVKENTAAHTKLAEVAQAAQKGGTTAKASPAKASTTKASTAKASEDTEAEENEAEAPEEKPAPKKAPAKKAPAKKAPAKKAPAKPKAPTLSAEVDRDEFKNTARAFMSPDDEDTRDANKEKFASALAHLGAKKLTEVDDEDLAKLAGYIAYWNAGLDVDFEEIDGLIAEAAEASSEESEDDSDDMLG
jgi:hypothetical protein